MRNLLSVEISQKSKQEAPAEKMFLKLELGAFFSMPATPNASSYSRDFSDFAYCNSICMQGDCSDLISHLV